ncbi:hypothetical protein BC477_20310 [Clavibacter michiganensis subsp. michiganensis]|uniref:Uncharacterized protein n=1 Tax=Clavibacter michiganensis subsp. michiganensis TaxID=33013 RepID=A0A251XD62_CLAMM|nr:hypothetical protein BC477_20310 [Clavibacter michiganensis subsp. michiganensis]OUE00047.1 hypothetical protein CMMCAS07_19850 [Clavibacter michiganensis subsp. michiganensis]
MAGTPWTGKLANSDGAPASGAITMAWCPRSLRCSSTRQTLVVTPLTVGRKLSLTTATRMPPTLGTGADRAAVLS